MHNVRLLPYCTPLSWFSYICDKAISVRMHYFSCSIHWYHGSTLLLAGLSYIHTITAAIAWSVKNSKTKMTKLGCRSNPAYQFDNINVGFRTPSKMFSSRIDQNPEDRLLQNQRFGSSCSCTTRSWNVLWDPSPNFLMRTKNIASSIFKNLKYASGGRCPSTLNVLPFIPNFDEIKFSNYYQ